MSLHPDFPVVEGKYQMTEDWSITLPDKFNRRFEDGELVIWKPGFTIWVTVWNNDKNETKEERLAWLRDEMSADAYDIEQIADDELLRLSYRLDEESENERAPAFYAFVFGKDGHVQMAIYFDDESDVEIAQQVWLSLEEN